MSIANNTAAFTSHTSLREMFGAFCCRIFTYQAKILSPIKEEAEIDANMPSIEAVVDPKDVKGVHHTISMIIKSIMDSEKVSSFQKSTKEIVYAMVAIADEIFLNMDWEGKKYWEENMLESRFFGSQIAGEEIFNRINEVLSEEEPLSLGKAEIYLNMLSLGFKGKFRGVEEEQIELTIYKNRLFEFIAKHDREAILLAEYRIFQREYTFTMPTIRRKLLPDGAIITYLSFFFVIMFLSISSMAWLFETRDLHKLLNEISEIALREH